MRAWTAISRRRVLRNGLVLAVLMVDSPTASTVLAAQAEKITASGSGVNLKLMPDVEGDPTVALRESFSFDAHYAQCIIEDNP